MKTEYTEHFNEIGARYIWKSIAAYELAKSGFNGDISSMVNSLDMSMEEALSQGGIQDWIMMIRRDIVEHMKMEPEFFKPHE